MSSSYSEPAAVAAGLLAAADAADRDSAAALDTAQLVGVLSHLVERTPAHDAALAAAAPRLALLCARLCAPAEQEPERAPSPAAAADGAERARVSAAGCGAAAAAGRVVQHARVDARTTARPSPRSPRQLLSPSAQLA